MNKLLKFSAAAAAASMIVTMGGADLFGANAQDSGEVPVQTAPITDETMPTAPAVEFVAVEVVQPLPQTDDVTDDAEIGAVVEENLSPAPSAASLRELIAATPVDGQLSQQLECLAGAIYFEARGEPIKGQLGVARVVVNRSEDRRFPDSYCDVVFQRAQFSFVRGGTMPRIKRGSTAWKRAKALAKIAHHGSWESEVRDALYFHANYVRPSWARKKSARATIKTHIFYR